VAAGYKIFGTLEQTTKTYVLAIQSTDASNPVIGAGTTIYLNTDQNSATGFTGLGAEYYVNIISPTTAYLQNSVGAVVSAALDFALSPDGKSIEVAVPQSLLTTTGTAGGAVPSSINVAAQIYDNGAVAKNLPTVFSAPEYVVTDPSTVSAVDHSAKKVAIVWSDASAANYFKGATDTTGNPIDPAALQTAYADLFMAAQHQAAAAGVSYDILTAEQIATATPADLAKYSALIFPSMANVQDQAQATAIQNVLYQVEYNYHVGIITSGDFMTKDASDAVLASPYAAMQTLLGITYAGGGAGTYSVSEHAGAISPIMAGYAPNELIGGASGQFAG
ncbi:MAG: hypothetical protein JSS20_22580, partial [Proteobacteria bacterium]|nr:hypothetical protein [Pseudomonadota bacterium]